MDDAAWRLTPEDAEHSGFEVLKSAAHGTHKVYRGKES
jgi:hypothetical protein